MKIDWSIGLIIGIFLGFTPSLFAQQGIDPEQNLRALGNLTPLSVGAIGFDNRYAGVQGTPLLFPEWQWGTIQFTKQDTFSVPYKLNVDLIKNTLIIQLRDGSLGEISANNVQAIQVKNEAGAAMRWRVASEKEVEGIRSVRLKFYQAFYDGKSSLLKSNDKRFKKADYKGAYNAGNTHDEFLTEEAFWLRVEEKPFEKIKIRRKEMENALSAQAAEVTRLTKTNKLNLNDVNDVAQLLMLLEKK